MPRFDNFSVAVAVISRLYGRDNGRFATVILDQRSARFHEKRARTYRRAEIWLALTRKFSPRENRRYQHSDKPCSVRVKVASVSPFPAPRVEEAVHHAVRIGGG